MKVLPLEEQAITGSIINLSTQEQIIIADAIEPFKSALEGAHSSKRIFVEADKLRNIVTLLSKFTQGVPSMQDCYNDLFDIEPEDTTPYNEQAVTAR